MNTNIKELSGFPAMLEEAKQVVEGDNVENMLVVVATKDGQLITINDINYPLTLTLAMMRGAAKAIFEAKRAQVQETDGAPEIVES